jgi:hypothetical protein
LFYDLKGKSFANSLQFDFHEIIKHFNFRSAYKYFDISTDYLSGSFQRPLQAKHRVFANLEYETHILKKENNGSSILLGIGSANNNYQILIPMRSKMDLNTSPSFSVMNAQITTFSSVFEIYVGGENIGNYNKQAVLGSDNPFGTNFDTSIVYAPIFGQMYYAGLRFKIK